MNKLLGMLGLARRAGKVSGGAAICRRAITGGRAELVILAEDAADNTRKMISDSCVYYGVRLIAYSNMADLGKAIGSGDRAVVSVNDGNFAKAISDIYNISSKTEKG